MGTIPGLFIIESLIFRDEGAGRREGDILSRFMQQTETPAEYIYLRCCAPVEMWTGLKSSEVPVGTMAEVQAICGWAESLLQKTLYRCGRLEYRPRSCPKSAGAGQLICGQAKLQPMLGP